MVSILIPAFDHERFVAECLDSVLADTYPAKELVVIDDGSRDGTLAVLERWHADHGTAIPMTLVAHPNHGLTRTANELLGLAKGVYVASLASDDALLPGGIAARVAFLEANPSAHAVFGDCVVVDDAGRILHESALFGYRHARRSWLEHRLAEELITNWSVAGPGLLYRRASIIAIGGYSEDLQVEDWDLYLRLAARGWLRFLDRPVAVYRLHARNEHRNPETERRRYDETHLVARRAAREFRGRRRLLLRLRALYMAPVWFGRKRDRLRDLPLLGVRWAIRELSRVIAALG